MGLGLGLGLGSGLGLGLELEAKVTVRLALAQRLLLGQRRQPLGGPLAQRVEPGRRVAHTLRSVTLRSGGGRPPLCRCAISRDGAARAEPRLVRIRVRARVGVRAGVRVGVS